jgi:hypothetical protein
MDSVVTQMRFLAAFACRSGEFNVTSVGQALDNLAQQLTRVSVFEFGPARIGVRL